MSFSQLKVVSTLEQYPITPAQLYVHGRQIVSNEDTAYIESLIAAATVTVENHVGMSILNRTLQMRLDCWPTSPVVLMYPYVKAIDHVRYIDGNGDEQTLDSAVYDADIDGTVYPRLGRAWGQTWPALRVAMGAVRIQYRVGMAAGSPLTFTTPPPLLHAIKMMAQDYYENRESQIASQYFGARAVIENPTIRRLLRPYTLEI